MTRTSKTSEAAKPPHRTLADLADALGGTLVGNGDFVVEAVAHPMMAEHEHVLALAMDESAAKGLKTTKAGAVAVSADGQVDIGRFAGGIMVKRPRHALALLLELFAPAQDAYNGVHPSAVVDSTAELAADVSVGAHVHVGRGAKIGAGAVLLPNVTVGAGARIGAHCLLHSGVRVGDRVVLGQGVILQPNATIGADGFSYVTPKEGSIEAAKKTGKVTAQNIEIVRINSQGTVVLGDGVEVGANSAVDRATLGVTRIGNGTKIDNLVQIGHNCTIGENCFIAGLAGIAGSVNIGDRVVIAGGVGIADHISIGDDAIVMAGSGVGRDVPPKAIVAGYPAKPKDEVFEELVNINRLGKIVRDVVDLKKRLAQLEKNGDGT